MVKIFIKFIVNSQGESPRELLERLRLIGGVPLIGEYDAEVPLEDSERLFDKLEAIHGALKGSGVLYTITSGTEHPGDEEKEKADDLRLNEMKKRLYIAKLERWREMGVDTKSLEKLLDTDLDKFREVSRDYLREHLDSGKVIEDISQKFEARDEAVLSAVDELGVTLENICRLVDLPENNVILSLGRLISAGTVNRLLKEGNEVYVRAATERATTEAKTPPKEMLDRILSATKPKGSTFKQICRETGAPEKDVMSALSVLLRDEKLKTGKRGKGVIYKRVRKS